MNSKERPLDLGPRWGLRFLLFFGLVLVFLVGGYAVWSSGSSNRLSKQAAAYKAAGEPIEPEDFLVSGVSDDDNAVVFLRRAAKVNETTQTWKDYDQLDPAQPLREKEIAAIRAVALQQAGALDEIDAAVKCKGVDWQIPFRQPVISVLLPDLNDMRQLAVLMKARALLRFHEDDHRGAIEDIRRIMFIGDAVGKQPLLVSHLVSVGINGIATDLLGQMTPDLKIGAAPTDATPEQVAQLIASLLDDKPQREGLRMALLGERMAQLDTTRAVASGRMSLAAIGAPGGVSPMATIAGVALKPLIYDDGLLMIRHTTNIKEVAQASPDWASYQTKSPGALPPEVQAARYRHPLAAMMYPSLDRTMQTDYRAMTDRRATATLLAIRWYALDHAGDRPAMLAALVPNYLPSIPIDAMSFGKPLNYVPDPSKPIVYSVGENGLDDGGSEATKLPGKNYRGRWQKADAVFHLDRQPREAEEDEKLDDGVGGLSKPPASTSPSTNETVD